MNGLFFEQIGVGFLFVLLPLKNKLKIFFSELK